MRRLVALVSPHGFGHAARSAAVLAALAERAPEIELEIWSTVPGWFFRESLREVQFRYRERLHDVGLVQSSALSEDLPATIAALEALWRDDAARRLADELAATHADAVLCDVSPLGLAAARRAGIRSILLENFTWDWIYEGYLDAEPRFAPWIERLGDAFATADFRLRAAPVCPARDAGRPKNHPLKGGFGAGLADAGPASPSTEGFGIPPIARRTRTSSGEVREILGIGETQAMVLVSLGGVETKHESLGRWRTREGAVFVVPGGADREERRGSLVLLPHRTPVYHPDLVRAADVVVGKLGYSTVAEAFAAGTRFAYLRRPAFRESEVLERFVRDRLPSESIEWESFAAGDWAGELDALLARERPRPGAATGAGEAAAAILAFLGGPTVR